MSIIGRLIIQPLIRRELKKMVIKDLKPWAVVAIQFIEKFGTKFVLALMAEAGIGYLAFIDKVEGWIAVVVMGFVAIAYFYARRMQEKEQIEEEGIQVALDKKILTEEDLK